jgi:hypothetical protein
MVAVDFTTPQPARYARINSDAESAVDLRLVGGFDAMSSPKQPTYQLHSSTFSLINDI